MAASHATVVAVVGDASADVIEGLSALRGVDALQLGEPDADGARRISASQGPYVVHDSDPLGHVAHAWVEFFDDRSTGGALDVEVAQAVSAFAAGERVMPDYYVVLEPESLEPTWRHWWFGALATMAPRRVLPQPAAAGSVRKLLRQLPTGPGWAAPDQWLPKLAFTVPDGRGLLAP
ncbi:hypothetical protein [Frondihabitans australicus]|uniref:Uncharacterized protein n=1 Tax=Frondihabitans australicus TaxID=386892 RepID=A0A495IEJ9_9MICO|nr:hypothetical protein [Frondihabitans australicus]RKR74413.1 hypothetical protein C8E83_1525 [Frondihabitans australicus]